MRDDTQCEVVDDEITVLGGKRRKNWSCGDVIAGALRCLPFKLSDNRSHHFAEGMVKEFFHFFTTERGHDSVGLFAVLMHVDQEIAQAIRPFLVACMSHDVCDDLSLENPSAQGHDIGEVIVKSLPGDTGDFGKATNCDLRDRCRAQFVFEGSTKLLASDFCAGRHDFLDGIDCVQACV